jgi:hypothetical protein
MSGTAEYTAWLDLRKRCYDPTCLNFRYYGAKGITVCERWNKSFVEFFKDMGLKPTPEHSIERLDYTKGYTPENCVWATTFQQHRNRSNNVQITFQGVTMCRDDWAKAKGFSVEILRYRLRKWTIEKSLTTPAMPRYGRARGRNGSFIAER